MSGGIRTPKEAFSEYLCICEGKVGAPLWRTLLLGVMAGAFIALGAVASSVSMHGIADVGVARTVGGAVFPIGLMLIMVIGGELFTGNCMLVAGVVTGRYPLFGMLRNLLLVYLSNFAGAALVAFLTFQTGQFRYSGCGLGAYVVKTAYGKVQTGFVEGFFSGVLCNLLVCAGVFMAVAAKDMAGKLFAVFFPIFVFVTCGFEHCVANMYYLTAGIFAIGDAAYAQKAMELYGYTKEQLSSINMGMILGNNLLPVTLGNLAGGMLCLGLPLTFLYREKGKN